MRNRRILVVILLLIAVLVSGCAAKMASPREQSTGSVAPGKAVPPAQPAAEEAGASYDYTISESQAQNALGERMIITTVNMSLLVEDTDQAVAELQALTASYQGYISESRRWYSGEQPYASLTLRIPAGSLSESLDRIRQLAIKVESENSSGEDVTEEYMDLDARLRNLEATETELLALLTEVRENRGKAEEILEIHRELTNIRGQIETVKGRQQYLERMTALATIHVELRPKAAPATVVEKVSWNPLVTGSRALRALVNVLRVLADIVIYVLILSPIFLVPAALIWLLVRLIRRRSKRQPTPPQA
ncbi:MAG: DUF4349 domain-containing protein [Chloroflexi bacterium]|jgi:hypothetical protein|nr:DUF4349 domain-containing protein [Chloroflexota bacterium]